MPRAGFLESNHDRIHVHLVSVHPAALASSVVMGDHDIARRVHLARCSMGDCEMKCPICNKEGIENWRECTSCGRYAAKPAITWNKNGFMQVDVKRIGQARQEFRKLFVKVNTNDG